MDHRRMLARLGLGAAALAVGLSATAPAFAAASGRIDKVDQAGAGHMKVAFSAVGLGSGESIDLASVKATIDGTPTDVVATKANAANTPDRKTMLTIDISGSMSQKIGTTQQTRI
ncbi:MAG TPA: hypothetical protein VFL59_15410, partial [Candidatus Nanopelagicales bacterium]|nr:hypothetical protein [Candidatus Nanopelagicales bacterium]